MAAAASERRPRARPAAAAPMPSAGVPSARHAARASAPCSARATTSSEKVEKVVNAPIKPVPSASMTRGRPLGGAPPKRPAARPSANEPATFIPAVAGQDGDETAESRHRDSAPATAPAATSADASAARGTGMRGTPAPALCVPVQSTREKKKKKKKKKKKRRLAGCRRAHVHGHHQPGEPGVVTSFSSLPPFFSIYLFVFLSPLALRQRWQHLSLRAAFVIRCDECALGSGVVVTAGAVRNV